MLRVQRIIGKAMFSLFSLSFAADYFFAHGKIFSTPGISPMLAFLVIYTVILGSDADTKIKILLLQK